MKCFAVLVVVIVLGSFVGTALAALTPDERGDVEQILADADLIVGDATAIRDTPGQEPQIVQAAQQIVLDAQAQSAMAAAILAGG